MYRLDERKYTRRNVIRNRGEGDPFLLREREKKKTNISSSILKLHEKEKEEEEEKSEKTRFDRSERIEFTVKFFHSTRELNDGQTEYFEYLTKLGSFFPASLRKRLKRSRPSNAGSVNGLRTSLSGPPFPSHVSYSTFSLMASRNV